MRVYCIFKFLFCSCRFLMRFSCSVYIYVLVEAGGEEIVLVKPTFFIHSFWYGISVRGIGGVAKGLAEARGR